MKIPVILGQTATGKTEIAVQLSKILPLEIISADSRQVYKHLTIGTNKPSGEWKIVSGEKMFIYQNTPYHLVDFVDLEEEYNAGKFIEDAERLVSEIQKRDKIPLIVGGTGLYITSFTDGLSILPKQDKKIREHLIESYKIYGKEYLYKLLEKYDPARAKEIHPNNVHRIIRALEIIYQTGKPVSKLVQSLPKTYPHNTLLLGLYTNKQNLVKKIKDRTDQMFNNGIVEETKNVLKKGYNETLPVFSSIGYNWILKYLKNEIDLETTKTNFVKDTLKYAKNQATWFKKDKRIQWLNCDDLSVDNIVSKVYKIIYTT